MPILRRKHKGFTLTEIMVVITIITLVIGVAIPNYLRMKASASSAAAIKTLRALSEVFEEFWLDQNPHRYPTSLSELDSVPAIQGAPAYIAENITSDSRAYGYYFSVVTPDTNTYSIQATPINTAVSGQQMFAIGVGSSLPTDPVVCPDPGNYPTFTDPSGVSPNYTIDPGHPSSSDQIPPELPGD